jgi:hypothetical protein
MTHQRTDRQVASDSARFNATVRDLKRYLRRKGIRNPHTSPKAREAIARASYRSSQSPDGKGRDA